MPHWWKRWLENFRQMSHMERAKLTWRAGTASVTTAVTVYYGYAIVENHLAERKALKEDKAFEETLDISEEDMARLREQYPRLSDSQLRRHHISMLKHYAALHKEVAAMEATIAFEESLKVHRKNSFIRRSLDDQE